MNNSLLDQYQKQWKWRDWESLYNLLPNLSNSLVYDLGCAHGDHSNKLSNLGARVVGLDGNQELLNFAKGRNIPNSSFIECDLNNISKMDLLEPADGVWMSFVAAYFTDFKTQLKKITNLIKPNGWIAITEMSGLLDHLPLDMKFQKSISEFYTYMLEKGAYDFNSGKKIKQYLTNSGFKIIKKTFLKDNELSQNGPCHNDVVEAWKNRFKRMNVAQSFLKEEYSEFKENFLKCLEDKNHKSKCDVYFYLAIKK